MGLFGGLLGGLFGGGGTDVSQTSSSKTDVNVDVDLTNTIDTTALAKAIDGLGINIGTVLKGLVGLEQTDVKTRQAQILTAMAGQKVEEQKTKSFDQVANTLLAGTAIYAVYRTYKRAR